MSKKTMSPFERDTWRRVTTDAHFAEAFFEDLLERPIAVQLSMLRRMGGLTQDQLASRAKVKQSFVSKLEKQGSDHRLSVYDRIARLLHGRIAIVLEGSKIVPPKSAMKLVHAA